MCPGVCSTWGLPQVLILFFFLFIHSEFLLCFLICFQTYFVSLPVVLCTHHQLVDRIFFRYFGRSNFICIAWSYLGTFWEALFCQYILIYFFQFYCRICLLLSFLDIFIPLIIILCNIFIPALTGGLFLEFEWQ